MRKSILKGLSTVFFAMEILCFGAQVSNAVTGMVLNDKAYKAYRATTEYTQDLDEKQAELLEKVNAGEMTLEESSKELKSFTSESETKERMINGNEQAVKTMYTISQDMSYAGWGLCGGVVLSALGSGLTRTAAKFKEND